MGWEPRTFTEYVYEGDRLVGSVATPEPEWDARQLSVMLAHQVEKSVPRNSLGIPISEATDPDYDPATWTGKRFVVEGPTTDFAEQAMARAQKKFYEGRKDQDSSGHLWSIRAEEL